MLLSSTGAITNTTLLSSAGSGPWSKGQAWLIDHSIVLPTDGKEARIHQGKLSLPRASYRAQVNHSLSQPAREGCGRRLVVGGVVSLLVIVV